MANDFYIFSTACNPFDFSGCTAMSGTFDDFIKWISNDLPPANSKAMRRLADIRKAEMLNG